MLTPIVVAVARSGPSRTPPRVAGGWPGPLRLIKRAQRSGRRGQRGCPHTSRSHAFQTAHDRPTEEGHEFGDHA